MDGMGGRVCLLRAFVLGSVSSFLSDTYPGVLTIILGAFVHGAEDGGKGARAEDPVDLVAASS
jgi:hypothetical protein